MKKELVQASVKSLANMCEKMAYKVSASACSWCTYQSKEPKSLRK